ncbi:amino acid ABC transporter permease [Phyllobacterium sp. YR531]|uniref:amino acid ABC transporter permease n=1 Tax=Phyllobacterium sp. YR531 TaxID=1144343 RepID=UPI00026FBA53|nr:amino acid ABC transporter permease [Phyllobacterium sp. YR531]EJN06748.1 amine acid ABC transporter, permease protein, 3-TM region, His/Glu/Gln/Arg/opine family [Phyllobacterium sp. YR531]
MTVITSQIRPNAKAGGAREWLRKSFFGNWFDACLSIVLLFISLKLGWSFLQWALLNAVWTPNAPELCGAGGACWSVISTRWRLIFFGLYPADEQWRAALACLIIVAAVVMTCIPRFFTLKGILMIWGVSFPSFLLLMGGGYFGLSPVPTERWSGLPLTLYIYASTILLGMPSAILIALGRRSPYPAIRIILGLVVDLVRSLPLLTILFSFSLVIPLFLPAQLTFDKVYRVIIGFTLFFACYQSEVIRGGLQSVASGQEEAARALGLNYFQRMGHVVLPQALRNTMPMTINQFVVTFKDTSFIVVVGLFELLAAAKSAYGVPEWSAYSKEVYVFIALIYFVFSYSMSKYGKYLELKMKASSAR